MKTKNKLKTKKLKCLKDAFNISNAFFFAIQFKRKKLFSLKTKLTEIYCGLVFPIKIIFVRTV